MKIYAKILLTTLPWVFVSLLAILGTAYYFSHKALTTLGQTWLSSRLTEAVRVVDEHQRILKTYGLESVSGSVAKARSDARKALSEMEIGLSGFVFVINGEGKILDHPRRDLVGRNVASQAWFRNLTPKSHGQVVFSLDGESFLAMVEYYAPWDWFILATDASTEVYGAFMRMGPYVFALLTVGAVVMALALMVMTRRITAPLGVLEAGARLIGAGNLETRIAVNTRDEVGSLATVFNHMADQLEETLEAITYSERHYRSLIENASGRITVVDRHGVIQYESPAVQRMLGFKPEELVGRAFIDFVYPEDQDRILGLIATLSDSPREIKAAEMRFLTADRVFRHLDAVFNNRLEDPAVSGIVVNSRDVSERKKAEAALVGSEKRYRDLFNSITDLIFTHDLEGRFISLNPAAAGRFGQKPGESLGCALYDFMPPEKREAFKADYLEPLKLHGHLDGVFPMTSRDGSEFFLECRSVLVQNDGQAPYVSGSGRDITERMMAQKELKRMEEQLLQSRKMEAVGILASGIAHDFNNILQAINGYVELLLKKQSICGRDRPYLEEVDRTVQRASELVRRLLTFSRKVEPRLLPVNLNQEIVQAVNILERTIPKMIRIDCQLAGDLCLVMADASQIEQAILNLGFNAKDAMPEGGRLNIRTQNFFLGPENHHGHPDLEFGEYVILEVEDTGLGMDQETVAHLFEPFFTTKDIGEGTGLGLSTVYGIVRAHGGFIACDSNPGHGTVFRIHLPAFKGEAGAPQTDEKASESPCGGQETVLVVDDEPAIIDAAKEALNLQGYHVLTASNGEDALELFRETTENIQVVVLDLGMPGMGGLLCLKGLLKLDPETRVIIASGYSTGGDDQATLKAGAKAFIGKPYRLNELLKTVRKVLDGS